ncbi:MAG: TolC family protein [Elusimicrobia bacterium]|nr:TolC family protein [Elusimicrobiota bacterium]
MGAAPDEEEASQALIFGLIVLALASAPSLRGQEAAAVRVLSWQDCVSLAARHNPELASSLAAWRADRSRYRGSFNALLPRLSLSNRYTDSRAASGQSRWQADGSASIDLFSMESYAGIRGASAALERSAADARARSSEIRLSLRTAFSDLLFAQEQLGVSRRVLDLRARNAELVSLKYDSGRESKGNNLRAEAELADAQAQFNAAGRALKVARRELARRIGLDEFEVIAASGTLEAVPLPAEADVGAIERRHPLLLQADASRRAARAALGQSRAALWPSLSASYSRTLQDRGYFPSQPGWSASGLLSYPLFSGGPTAALHDISAARRDLEGSEQELRSVRYQVRSELESAWAELAESVDQVEVRRRFLEAARQRNEEASIRYSAGLMSFENWELIVTELVNSERGWVRARRDAMVARAAWDRSLGAVLEE